MTTDVPAEPEAVIERRGASGHILLNRPKALNALTHGMVRAIRPELEAWRNDPAITRVVITGAGEKAFCAGGDIRALYDLGKAGRVAESRAFWREEYILNHEMKTYPKPIVALIGGIVMGGGVGVSIHGSHRVATEKLMFAMPEVGIGFFPDVGASSFLPRLPRRAGVYLALTGARIGLGDALALGLVTHGVAHDRLSDVGKALEAGDDVDATLERFTAPPPPSPLFDRLGDIEEALAAPTLAGVVAGLEKAAAAGSAFAVETLATMRTKSPTSMAVALEQVRRGGSLSFADVMQMEYRVVSHIGDGHDFYEGVRAVIVDKDQKPIWKPARIEDLEPAAIKRHFEPVPDDLDLG